MLIVKIDSVIEQMTQYRYFQHILLCDKTASIHMGFQPALCLGKKNLDQSQILKDKQELQDFYQGKSPTVQAESREMHPSAPVTSNTHLPNS